jgi:hypothetical protein
VRRRVIAASLAALACTTTLVSPREARADVADAFGIVLITLVVTDLVFVAGNTVYVARAETPSKAWGTTEAIVGAPQAVIAGIATPVVSASVRDKWAPPLISLTATFPTFMAVHGTWTATTSGVDPGALYGVSWATSANGMLTLAALGRATSGRLGGSSLGIVEMVATSPQMAVASVQAARPHGSDRAGWIALDAWAFALFVHGVASVVAGSDEGTSLPAEPPPPPPLPPPPAAPHSPDSPITPDTPFAPPPPVRPGSPVTPDPPSTSTSGRAPAPTSTGVLVPRSVGVAPLPIGGGAGIGVQGLLW